MPPVKRRLIVCDDFADVSEKQAKKWTKKLRAWMRNPVTLPDGWKVSFGETHPSHGLGEWLREYAQCR